MTPDPNLKKLTALQGYIEFVLSKFPPGENESEEPYVLILVCAQKSLERRIAKTRPTVEWVQIMRWSVDQANALLDALYQNDESVADWNPMTVPKTLGQNLAGWLMVVQSELLADIGDGEAYLQAELETAADAFVRESIYPYITTQ